MKPYAAILAALFLLAPALPAAAPNPAGLWEGTLKTPNGDLGFLFNLHQDAGRWTAEMDVPMQSVSELPLKDVKVDGAAVTISIPGQGDPHYEGKLSEDGKTIAGNFHQGTMSLPMDLKWKSAARAVSQAEANSGEVQVLEGVWEGALDVNGNQLHLRFTFTKGAGGAIAGTLDSVEQGADGLPVSGISRTGDQVKLDLKTIGGSFEGALDKDAATMTGKFTQGGGTLPLVLHRKPAAK